LWAVEACACFPHGTPRRKRAALRREQTAADKRAAIVVAIGFALTFVALIGLPGPDAIFMGAAPVIAVVCAFPALMSMWMERYRGGFARVLLLIGAAALAGGGFTYADRASMAHVLLAYFIPAVLFAAAATSLARPRMRAT